MSHDDHPTRPEWGELVRQCEDLVERVESRAAGPAGARDRVETPEAAFDRLRAEYRQADGPRSPTPRPAGRGGWLGRIYTRLVSRRTGPR